MALKKEIRLCDTCENKVSEFKCDCCNADMCTGCVADQKTIRVNSQEFGVSMYCIVCKKKYNQAARGDNEFFSKDFKEDISKEIKDYIKKRIFTEQI